MVNEMAGNVGTLLAHLKTIIFQPAHKPFEVATKYYIPLANPQ